MHQVTINTPFMRTSIQKTIQMKTIIRPILIIFTLLSLGLVPITQAVSPAPDGGYPGQNTAEGDNALFNLSPTDGGFNTAIGWLSLFANATGSFNTGVGAGTLWANTSHNNTAVGAGALVLNTTGDGNTANGAFALIRNTIGRGNTATGGAALFSNTNGSGNTAVGARALFSNIGGPEPEDGSLNTAVGLNALTANTIGGGNTAVGAGPGVLPQPSPNPPSVIPGALGSNTIGSGNTAVGASVGGANAALGANISGTANTAVGAGDLINDAALGRNTTGDDNTAVGAQALRSNTAGGSNTAIGARALKLLGEGGPTPAPSCSPSPSCTPILTPTPPHNNIAVGRDAGSSLTTGDYNIYIGNAGMAQESNTIRIGTEPESSPAPPAATYIAHIYTNPMIGTAVVINSNGQLGAATSSARFKTDIESMDKSSETIFALRPVSFHYKQEIDPKCQAQFGLVAEEVEKVNPALVVRDSEGKPYTVRYDAVNAMLLNEFLKEHNTVQDLKKEIAALTATVKEQDARLQRVSAQIELNKPPPRTVLNNQ